MKNERGITLIALVVTIVVLLILTGITINTVVDRNGVLGKAQQTQNDIEDSISESQGKLENLMDAYNEISSDNYFGIEETHDLSSITINIVTNIEEERNRV